MITTNDLVSASGICFVASQPTEPPIPVSRPPKKYRPRGERTRQQQLRDASRNYYRIHRLEILAKRKADKMKGKK